MKARNTLRRLMAYMKGSRRMLLLALISAMGSVALTLMGPAIVGEGIDAIVGPGQVDFVALIRILVILLGMYVLTSFLQWLLAYATNMVGYSTVRSLREEAFEKLHRVPLAYIDHTPHGDTVARIVADAESVCDGLLQGLSNLLTGVATIVGTLMVMLSMNGWITLIVVCITPLSIFVAGAITSRSHHLFREQSRTQGELTGYVSEMVGNQKLVKAFSYEDEAQKSFDEVNERLRAVGVRAQIYSALVNPCTRFVNNSVYVAVGAVGGLIAVTSGTLSIGQISACLTYANQYTKPFNEISSVMTQLQTAFAALSRLFALLDEEEELPDAPDAITPRTAKGAVAMEQVSFGYTKERTLIKNLSLHVKPGQRIAIVGPTGAGKSTLVNLLMRFYEVDSGKIRIDGTDIRAMTRRGERALFGMVLQESWLKSGTVRENIAYGRPEATQEEVILAAKRAHAHRFIERLPQGYDTVLTEGGANMSQGQRQLLCIARVMLCDPPLLLLDEATSSIDTRTEKHISEAFDAMMAGRTSFVVAHRLSTIRNADVILVMREGDIVEQGTHEGLLAQGGFYAQLYNSQFEQTKTQA